MSRSLTRWILASVPGLVVVFAASFALAQPGAGGRGGFGGGTGGFGGFGGGGSVLTTLLNDQVQKELEVSDEQKASLTKLNEESRGQRPDFQALQNLSAEERADKMKEFQAQALTRATETNKKVNDILLPSQQERLKEIIVQTRGVQAAANNEDLAKALGLTDEQKQKIKDIAAEDVQKIIEEKILTVLTADQKAKLEKMKAKKFELDRTAAGAGRGNRGGNNAAPGANPAPGGNNRGTRGNRGGNATPAAPPATEKKDL